MDNNTIIRIIQTLAENDLLLIDTGEVLVECDLEVHRKKDNAGKEVVLFMAKEREA